MYIDKSLSCFSLIFFSIVVHHVNVWCARDSAMKTMVRKTEPSQQNPFDEYMHDKLNKDPNSWTIRRSGSIIRNKEQDFSNSLGIVQESKAKTQPFGER